MNAFLTGCVDDAQRANLTFAKDARQPFSRKATVMDAGLHPYSEIEQDFEVGAL